MSIRELAKIVRGDLAQGGILIWRYFVASSD